jgi:hypothetical protein
MSTPNVHVVDHSNPHPNVYGPAQHWSADQTLHVAVAYSNPFRYQRRRASALDCLRHLRSSPNVVVHVGEVAYGDRPFEITSPDHPTDYQWRTADVLFHKENILDLVIAKFPMGWKYGCYVDADITFTRHDWALETIHQLQMYDWLQMFSHYVDLSGPIPLGSGHRPISHPNPQLHDGFMFNYCRRGFKVPPAYQPSGWKNPSANGGEYDQRPAAKTAPGVKPTDLAGATGLAWAFTAKGINTTGGLMERCILGSGDWFMAFGLVAKHGAETMTNQPPSNPSGSKFNPDYLNYIDRWQQQACKLEANTGYVDQVVMHHFHGAKRNRQYGSRDRILIRDQFSPYRDVKPDSQGVLQLAAGTSALRDDIRQYFLSRNEDDPSV